MPQTFGPHNGLYLTRRDNESFNDTFSSYYQLANGDTGKALSLTFVVTEQCNLRCSYCYEIHKTGRRMELETAKAAIDQLLVGNDPATKEYGRRPAVVLEFIGGEPLLEIELIDQITEYFKEAAFLAGHPWATNYMLSMSTNGVLYFDPKVQDYLHKNRGKVSLGISVDGDKQLHDACRVFPDGSGSYDLAVTAARDLLQHNPRHSTKSTLSPDNIQYLFRAIKHLHEDVGYQFINSNCVFEEGWTMEHAKIFYAQLIQLADYLLEDERYRTCYVSLFDDSLGQAPDAEDDDKNWCGGNGDMLAVGCDGKFYPCLRFMQMSLANQPERPIGDIQRGFFFDPVQTDWYEKLKTITMKTQSNEECRTCAVRKGCAICLGHNYDAFGDPNHRATYICEMHKARVCANAYYWNKLYQQLGLDQRFVCNTPNIYQ